MFRTSIFAVLVFGAVFSSEIRAQNAQLGPPPVAPQIAPSQASQAAAASPAWLVMWQRELVRNSYQNVYVPSQTNITVGWTGNGASCTPGTTLQSYQNTVAERVNWYRSAAGVPPWIAFGSSNNAEDQQAALMMSVNQAISHDPPATWTCYTSGGATAAGSSNLCYSTDPSYFEYDPGCVQLYIYDPGAGNSEVGHRRWILYPQTQTMGTGDVPGAGSDYTANALWAFDSNYGGPRPATRDYFVAWPPKGYVPSPLVFQRWSFSYPSADFTASTVAMSCNGASLALVQDTVANGYGENTLVWEPSACSPSPGGPDTIANVTISNVVIDGSPQAFAYTVRIFDPTTTIASRIGTFNQGSWLLDVNGNGVFDGSPPDLSASFGFPGATYVTGDWNGDGRTKIGVYYNGFWYLDYDGNGVWDGGVNDKAYTFGWAAAGVTPMLGDWNGDGRSKIGIYYNGFWYLDYDGNGVWDGGVNDKAYVFGWAATGVTPITGDWSAGGTTKIGIYYNGYWYLDYDGNGVWDGGVNDKAYAFGGSGVTPLIGDWNGDGTAKIGVFANGHWYLDYNGNGTWDGPATDRFYTWGHAGDTPITGTW